MSVKVNVKRFSRSKIIEEPIINNEPIIEKKTRGRKKKEVTIVEEPIIEEPIIEEPIVDEPVEIDDNFFI